MTSSSLALVAIASVAALAWLLRRNSASTTSDATAFSPPPDPERSGDPPGEPDGDDEELALTSDGRVFMPDGRSIRLVPLADAARVEAHREDIEAGMIARGALDRGDLLRAKMGAALDAGDFTAARARRGAAGVVPWRVETLGRDGEYGVFEFETQDGARAALAMIERLGIVRRPRDEEGRPIPPSVEDFEEGRRRYEESLRALMLDPEGGLGPPGDYSDRR